MSGYGLLRRSLLLHFTGLPISAASEGATLTAADQKGVFVKLPCGRHANLHCISTACLFVEMQRTLNKRKVVSKNTGPLDLGRRQLPRRPSTTYH